MAFLNKTKTSNIDAYYPQEGVEVGTTPLLTDPSGSLVTRGAVLSDETSFRDDFVGGALAADWIQALGTGGSVSVASSILTLNSGTTATDFVSVTYEGDYLPLTFRGFLSISARRANQSIVFGLTYRNAGVIEQGAWFLFTGTNAARISCVTQSGAGASNVEQTTDIPLPQGLTTATQLYYKLDVSNNLVTFQVKNSQQEQYYVLASHELHIPDPYQLLNVEISAQNTGNTTNTAVLCDLAFLNNMNRLQIDADFQNEPMPVVVNTERSNFFKAAVNSEIEGVSGIDLRGFNPNIGGGATADIWGGGATFTLLTTAVQHNIRSSTGTDTSGGVGARTVLVTGLDANYELASETITMNGTTNVLTTKSYIFIYSLEVLTTGTNLANTGNITATSTGVVVATQAYMPVGDNASNSSAFLVPFGCVAFCFGINASFINSNNNSTATILLLEQPFGLPAKVKERYPLTTSSNNNILISRSQPFRFPEKTLIRWRCTASTANSSANISFPIILQQRP